MSKQSPSSLRHGTLKPSTDALTLTSLLCAAGGLAAQDAGTQPAPVTKENGKPGTKMKEVLIEADAQVYNPNRLQSPKFTEPLRNIPQTITVIPKAVIEDRGAFSLRDVLRNTPGISMQAGEGATAGPGGGGNASIRGFTAATDWFFDGIRDYGFYNRDPFNIEAVEVLKGPSSSYGGRGTAGGVINLVTKMAHLGSENLSTFSYGSSNLYRGTVDVNEQLSEHTALRVNGLYHNADVPGRDDVYQERWGIAASLAFGLGTDTRFTVNYSHLNEDNLPDWGIPFIANAAAGLGPVGTPPPVSYNTYYGALGVVYEKIQHDAVTAIFEHDFSDRVKLRNIFRYSRNDRDSITTAPRFIGATTTLRRELKAFRLTNEAFVNQTNLNVDFDTGPLKHALVTGLELTWERQLSDYGSQGNFNNTSVFDPDVLIPGGTGIVPAMPGAAEAHMDTVGIYVFDTVKIGRFFEINGGVRYDHIQAQAQGFGGALGIFNSDDLFNWKASLVFKPTEYGSIYFGYGTSKKVSLDGASLSGMAPTTAAAGSLDPEEARSFELGTKWDLFKERLSLTAALFRTERNDALVRSPVSGAVLGRGGEQVVDGIELGIAGNLTKHWKILAGYSWMDGRVTSNGALGTGPLSNVPESSGNLWTTYSLLDERLEFGVGLQYMGQVHMGRINAPVNGSTPVASDYLLCDAMVSYQFTKNFSLRFNIYNLANKRYIDSGGGTVGHFIPGVGRWMALTASIKF